MKEEGVERGGIVLRGRNMVEKKRIGFVVCLSKVRTSSNTKQQKSKPQ